MKAKVINEFRDAQHGNHLYQVGDDYPAEGKKAGVKRIRFLSAVHPKFKKAFIKIVEDKRDEVGE